MTITSATSLLRQRILRTLLAPMLLLLFITSAARAAEVIPPVPARHFNDYANVVSATAADQLDQQLEQFERDASNQILVVIYPKMQSDSDIADYSTRVFHAWHVGEKNKDNGAVLFVFIQDKSTQIVTGYGLEGALPDALAKDIIDQTITPLFKTGNYEAGLRGGVGAIIAATKGEYKGTGHTGHDRATEIEADVVIIAVIAIVLLPGLLLLLIHFFGGSFYQQHQRSLSVAENIYLFLFQLGLNLMFSGGSSGSGGGRSGGFSSGGGDTGGGGAGGKW